MFSRVLIANRGEIACRVIDTCRRLGIETLTVYADPDRRARHVRLADRALPLDGIRAADTYLDIDKIISIARENGAQAIHPGYGFLAENPAFARACEAAGIVFIGPTADTIEAMGSKTQAKRIMEQAGVPCTPGYHGDAQDGKTLAAEAERIGFPLLIKPSAGGGGKGMRIVHDADGIADALAGAQREAQSAFGDDRVLLERWIESPRHIEFQVFGDHHGNTVHLFERECSIQRRYQKIIEESPSAFLDADLRARMGEAAVAAARAVGYRNAGTVEFIVGPDGGYHFMEMNTRLQVEHPVTELVTGLDLVEWQLKVAAGEALPAGSGDLAQAGHAIEVRIYAENPDKGFVPATGRIRRFAWPTDQPGLRVDTGAGDGDDISPHYDPMIAKLCVHAEDRPAAVERLRAALDRTAVFGLATNLPLLRAIAREPGFAAGRYDTGYIEQLLDTLLAMPGPAPEAAIAAAAAHLRTRLEQRLGRTRPYDGGSPWRAADGWRMQGGEFSVHLAARGQAPVRVDAGALEPPDADFSVLQDGADLVVAGGGGCWDIHWQPEFPVAPSAGDDETHPGSPMPGRIAAIHVQAGDRVEPGQALLVLEAMKMEYTLEARTAGTVERVLYDVGDMVEAEAPLVDICPDV